MVGAEIQRAAERKTLAIVCSNNLHLDKRLKEAGPPLSGRSLFREAF